MLPTHFTYCTRTCTFLKKKKKTTMRMKEVLTLRGSCLSLHVEVVDLYRRQAEETIPHRGRNEMSSTEPVEKTWVDAIGS